jgi:hypothetical protein
MLLWLSRGDLKGETASEITAAQDQTLKTKYHVTLYYKQKQTPNADFVHNLMKQYNTYYQHAQH